jgi:aspartate/methionine/tyrosine aminotransferase
VPRFPDVGSHAVHLQMSVFATLGEMMRRAPPGVIQLHVGDAFCSPPAEARFEAPDWPTHEAEHGLYRYGHPHGLPELRAALAEKLRRRNGLMAGADDVQVTCGATQAIFAGVRALLDPGDEVLVAAPYWPLIRGIVRAAGGVPVEVPLTQPLYDDPGADPAALLEPHVTPRTVALYLITPNNPDGKILSRAQLERLAAFCQAHDLWCLADEAYEEYVFPPPRAAAPGAASGRAAAGAVAPAPLHVSIGALPGMADRTLTSFTFSKSYAMSGTRLGYLYAPEPARAAMRRIANHVVYNPPDAAQWCGLGALRAGDAWVERMRRDYAEARDLTVDALRAAGAEFHAPEGGAYVFARVPPRLAAGGSWAFIERAVQAGVSLAPGEAFGRDYTAWFRVCYTAVGADDLREGLARLARALASGA